jgi:hypothetical protein
MVQRSCAKPAVSLKCLRTLAGYGWPDASRVQVLSNDGSAAARIGPHHCSIEERKLCEETS